MGDIDTPSEIDQRILSVGLEGDISVARPIRFPGNRRARPVSLLARRRAALLLAHASRANGRGGAADEGVQVGLEVEPLSADKDAAGSLSAQVPHSQRLWR